VSSTVEVDGRLPEGVGVVWVPRTVCVGSGVGVEEGVAVGDTVVGVGDRDCAPDGDGVTAEDGDAVCVVDVLCAGEVGDAPADVGDEVGLAKPGAGRSAIEPVEDAANTAVPTATRARSARIGTTAIRLPRGKGSRQFGQNPDTGVVTYPQFRHRTGRRVRAMAWLAAFSMRDRI
jgi:hypothetical protein